MQSVDPIVGVFRDHTKADHAIEELKQAGFTEDQITSAVYGLQPEQEPQTHEDSRIIVTIEAEGREQQVFDILLYNGANNADLPPGMELRDGRIVRAQAETVDVTAEPAVEAGFTKDSFYAEATEPGQSGEIMIMDNPNAPHG